MPILFILLFLLFDLNGLTPYDPDEYRNTIELITSKGYPAEEHPVQALDGHILNIHRIPTGRDHNRKISKPVVFLQHGLLDSSATWVLNMADQSLGFILADLGFDVWLGNMRGNTYCLTHAKYNPSQEEFWDFSFDEMAAYDMPAMINYVLNYTEQSQLVYIGHSQGTLISFARLGSDFDLASKIKLFIGLGPVSTVGHMIGLVHYLGKIGEPTEQEILYLFFGRKEFFPSNKYIHWLADNVCDKKDLDLIFCRNIIFLVSGPSHYLNYTRIDVYVEHTPAGTSVKNMAHYAQMSVSDKFQMYDYGTPKANQMHYNQTTPPEYRLDTIKVPVALYWAKNDWLADPADVQYLRDNLPNIVDDYEIQNWNHLDFIWGVNAREALYDRMIELIKKYL